MDTKKYKVEFGIFSLSPSLSGRPNFVVIIQEDLKLISGISFSLVDQIVL
jgi:hypothetical protein